MAKKDDALIEQVATAIAAANEKNGQRERFEIALLLILFLGGMSLLILAVVTQIWVLLVPGSLIQFTTAWPLRQIARLREDKVRLQIVLQLMKLATTKEAKSLAAQLVRKLIDKV